MNSLLRFGNGSWDMNNAVQLIKYSQSKGYKLAGWELGNEPNVYKGHDVVSPSQLSEDYVKLRNILQQLVPGSLLIGPSVTMLVGKTVQYFVDFLKGPGSNAINASTFHHYYGYEGNFNLLDFLNPKILDNLIPEINIAKKYTKEYCPEGTQVWLGETSSVWGEGKPGYSDRYVAGFMWLDKLGLSAQLGIDTVMRQDFYGGQYGLLNSDGFPNPDYWLTLLYKLLVGSKVLNKNMIEMKTKITPEHLRFYTHCTNIKRTNYTKGSITVYGMNLNAVDAAIYFDQYIESELHLYLLEPSDNYGLTSGNVSLNGRHLEITENGNIPNLLTPKVVRNPVIIPGFRFGFVVIPSANKNICY
ncbi:hypothetical protein KUTeg_022917 [Tegillarca granosa]|uniref:Uncharacterized protein n=1 Tax=Tegillarca granosa TaxID=220873 RepID=A0ABQ9E5M8_TEGGR|nr:hypothetical protein KUTeg_022917 [Tegillarca granosa]